MESAFLRSFLKDGDVLMFTQGGPKVSFLTPVGRKNII